MDTTGWDLIHTSEIDVSFQECPGKREIQRRERYARQIGGVWYYQDKRYVKTYSLVKMLPIDGKGDVIKEWIEGEWEEV